MSGRESGRDAYSRNRSGSRDSYEGKGKGKERERESSRYSDYSDDEPDEDAPQKHHFDEARTKNRRKEFSHWYVRKDAPQSERKWSLNKRSGKYDDNPRHVEDREATSKGNRAAVRDLDRYGVAHQDFAYADSSPGFSHSEKHYANDDHECREPDSYAVGPKYRYVPVSAEAERLAQEKRAERARGGY
ncbi:hypothetical protein LTR84_011217 [Exophiala bonariae]|uniref:Btz domain-containing protein n=1 Tax=Exophiala bonariae TaxID=1690606 RepID=A0AAV9NM90_9EURO|nr:hypothetical protein LTR84_011217 [Exophiala bonariae]